MSQANRVTALVVLGLGLAWALLSLRLPLFDGKSPGPGFMPLIIGIFIGGLGIALALERNRGDEKKTDWPSGARLFRLLVTFGSLAAYVLLVNAVGFLASTVLFLIGMIRFWGGYSWRFVILLGIILAGVSYFVFMVWLDVPLPTGLLLNGGG